MNTKLFFFFRSQFGALSPDKDGEKELSVPRTTSAFSSLTCVFRHFDNVDFFFLFAVHFPNEVILLFFLYLYGFCLLCIYHFHFTCLFRRRSASLAILPFSTVVTKNQRRRKQMSVKLETTNTPLRFALIEKTA